MTKTYKLDVTETEQGEAVIQFPEDVLEQAGWNEGDNLQWTDNGDGSWTLAKLESASTEEKEWVLVECISTFRHRYMVQVPEGKAEWALDTVVMEDANEFSQLHLGETIVSHRVVTEDEALAICDEDNDYCSSWPDEKKMEVLFTTYPLNTRCNDD